MGKPFSRRVALAIYELDEGRIDHLRMGLLKILQLLYTMQELAIAYILAITSCNVLLQGFKNDGVQKKDYQP